MTQKCYVKACSSAGSACRHCQWYYCLQHINAHGNKCSTCYKLYCKNINFCVCQKWICHACYSIHMKSAHAQSAFSSPMISQTSSSHRSSLIPNRQSQASLMAMDIDKKISPTSDGSTPAIVLSTIQDATQAIPAIVVAMDKDVPSSIAPIPPPSIRSSGRTQVKKVARKSTHSHYRVSSDEKATLKMDADLRDHRQNKSLAPNLQKAAGLIGIPSSAYHNMMLETPLLIFDNSEVYHRSGKHPLVNYLDNEMYIAPSFPIQIDDKHSTIEPFLGNDIYLGNFKNSIEALGDDQLTGKVATSRTSVGDATLFDLILNYKNSSCRTVVDEFNKQNKSSDFIKVGHHNSYPNVMIYFVEDKIKQVIKEINSNPSEDAFENFVNCMISCFTGLLNARAMQNKIPIELIRRSSFGFSIPTIAPTGPSIRLSIGITPSSYHLLIAGCLAEISDILPQLISVKLDNKLYGSNEHKTYLGSKRANQLKNPTNIFEYLFAPADKAGKSIATNMMRSSSARDSIAAHVYNSIIEGKYTTTAFELAIQWALDQFRITQNSTLNFNQNEPILYKPVKISISIHQDDAFWKLINSIIAAFTKRNKKHYEKCLTQLKAASTKKELDQSFYYHLVNLIELVYVDAITTVSESKTENEDGYGSDSDVEEDEKTSTPLFGKKIITCNGMYAIWGAVKTACDYFKNAGDNSFKQIYFDESYYEVQKGFKFFSKGDTKAKEISLLDQKDAKEYKVSITPNLNKFLGLKNDLNTPSIDEQTITTKTNKKNETKRFLKINYSMPPIVDNLTQTMEIKHADIILQDLNHCVTNAKASAVTAKLINDISNKKNKILILDNTSSITAQTNSWLKEYKNSENIVAIFLVSSGVKNEQLGADKNQYGTIRVFTKNKLLRNEIYNRLKENTSPVRSIVSHTHRRIMKQLGAVPTNTQLLQPTHDDLSLDLDNGDIKISDSDMDISPISKAPPSSSSSHPPASTTADNKGDEKSPSTSQPTSTIIKIAADGHCLFRALGYLLYKDDSNDRVLALRKITKSYFDDNALITHRFMTDAKNGRSIDAWKTLCNMDSNIVWGGDEDLQILSYHFKAHIIIYCENQTQIRYTGIAGLSDFEIKSPKTVLHLYYSGGNHFDAVIFR